MICAVCGGKTFSDAAVIWDGLAEEWGLSPAERAYVDRQQGTTCDSCKANLRSAALAAAICCALGKPRPLRQAFRDVSELAVLEINAAGTLSRYLRRAGGYVFGAYPTVDMHALPYADAIFDLVVHSDTLEHVTNPLKALKECRRVLKPTGCLCYTVPIIIGRLTRSREGLPPSYHGDPTSGAADYLVRTEYGADVWTQPLEAGFASVEIVQVAFPAAMALTCRSKTPPRARHDQPGRIE